MFCRSAFALAALIALAGCNETTGIELTRDDVPLKLRSSVPKDRILGTLGSVVRAYQVNENGKQTEVDGARCELRSKELSGRVQTPQIVRYPSFLQGDRFADRGKPGQLVIKCRAGKLSGVAAYDAITTNLSSGGYSSSYVDANGKTTSATFVVPVSGKVMSTTYPWRYDVTLKVLMQ